MIEEEMVRALHVEAMRAADLHAEHRPHVLFQASTIGALLDGRYDGDVTFAELAEHGDTGLGTLNALDGEMIALDGRFLRADREGRIGTVPPEARTPFAVVAWFAPDRRFQVERGLDLQGLQQAIDACLQERPPACAVRVEGRFARVRARSVPRQSPPYRPLAEVVADQNVFELGPCEGTVVGFRFPAYAEGIEVAGYHLHFVDAERSRGGHVLGLEIEAGEVAIDGSSELHIELPAGVDLASPGLAGETHAAIERAERG